MSYPFPFMQANGGQRASWPSSSMLAYLRRLIDKTFPFDETLEALAYVEQGRANGKVVIMLDYNAACRPTPAIGSDSGSEWATVADAVFDDTRPSSRAGSALGERHSAREAAAGVATRR